MLNTPVASHLDSPQADPRLSGMRGQTDLVGEAAPRNLVVQAAFLLAVRVYDRSRYVRRRRREQVDADLVGLALGLGIVRVVGRLAIARGGTAQDIGALLDVADADA